DKLVARGADDSAAAGEVFQKRQIAGWEESETPRAALAGAAVNMGREAEFLQGVQEMVVQLIATAIEVDEQVTPGPGDQVADRLPRQSTDHANARPSQRGIEETGDQGPVRAPHQGSIALGVEPGLDAVAALERGLAIGKDADMVEADARDSQEGGHVVR